MEPVAFPYENVVFAKDQPQYKPLPAYKSEDGTVVTCWKISFLERIKLLITGQLWLTLLTFNKPLQPVLIQVQNPFIPGKEFLDGFVSVKCVEPNGLG